MRSSMRRFSWTAGRVYSSAPHGNSLPGGGHAMAALTRRDFLLTSAAVSGAALVSLDTLPAHSQTPKQGGTLRLGFYLETATTTPPSSSTKIDPQFHRN